jgi:hypothetical protein
MDRVWGEHRRPQATCNKRGKRIAQDLKRDVDESLMTTKKTLACHPDLYPFSSCPSSSFPFSCLPTFVTFEPAR